MALDRSKLHKGFQTYLANAEKASGRTYDDMSLVLSQSGLKKHGELRSHLMDRLGLGHGHANAVVAIWLMPGNGGPALAVESEPVKGAVRKAAAKKVARKPAAKAMRKPATKTAKKPAPKKTPAKKK
jgi:hypothetical protein